MNKPFVKRILSALGVLLIASALTGILANLLYSQFTEGYSSAMFYNGILATIWLLMVFIGYRASEKYLR